MAICNTTQILVVPLTTHFPGVPGGTTGALGVVDTMSGLDVVGAGLVVDLGVVVLTFVEIETIVEAGTVVDVGTALEFCGTAVEEAGVSVRL